MKNTKMQRKSDSVSNMWRTLKRDIKSASDASYCTDGLSLTVKGHKVHWSLTGKHLYRWNDAKFTLTSSDLLVKRFDFQGLWGEFLAIRLVDAHGTYADMFRVW